VRLGPATFVVIVTAVLLGLAGAYGVRQYLKPPPAVVKPAPVAEPPKPKKYKVPFAMYDLPANRKIAISDVSAVELTREEITKRKLPPDAPLDFRYVIGRYLKEPVAQSGHFQVSKLYPAGVEPSLSDLLKPGQRAVTVPIKPVHAAGGFATPGTSVDVVFRTTRSASEKDAPIPEVTFTLLDGVQVLALGDSKFPGAPPTGTVSSVTLAVTPDQAQMLQVVEGKGELTLAVRAVGTKPEPPAVPDKMTLERLLGLESAAPPFTAEIYRGSNKQTLTFGPKGPRVVGAQPVVNPGPAAAR
jgi:pilus assembly protein CpaB